jgi:hypothetical protein
MPSPALAHSALHPEIFALPATCFPADSHVVRAGIEPNRRLLNDDAQHFGLRPAVAGRRTGYYMDAVEGDRSASVRPYTSYLVSIFRSAPQARLAFDYRWDLWFTTNYYTSPAPAPISVGDAGEEALFHTLDPTQPPLSELFFRRGAVLVEVFQGTPNARPTATQLRSFYTIAARLNALAGQHPLGE